ncbi:SPFH/Band 7/PHB domain protein [Alicyclobacillus fastidiosus]|uniref:SPFH/Band 7/PHB domain protein n=1 Tax=Alicyclobacillus fastidiosus TaxID=392011 RepID=A0ABY6ZIW7_9BACL|nr:SPFH domain-containing protein [Alicyclobacillus fastidiosus]WAH42870.1 SPFH/Band 7/PHB domain protein [Alicyclobacillus fastidiosus]GMA64805.1 peptidase [Alicyclobacillus fastidiosus]
MIALYVVLAIIVIFVVVLVVSSIKIVNQNEVYMIERLGKFYRKAQSGLNLIVPFIDKVVNRVDLRTQVIDSPPQSVITRDNVSISIDAIVYFRVTDPYNATYQIDDVFRALEYLTATNLRDVIGSLDLDGTLSSREQINTRLRISLDEATDPWGVKVERVEVKNINPPSDIREAMEKQMRAEREKRAAILTAEGEKQAAITQAEGRKQAVILEAEAVKESNIRRAEGEAAAIRQIAEAEASKIQMIYGALRAANVDERMLAVKGIEAFEHLADSDNKVFVPYEASAVMGAFGAVQSLLGTDKSTK